MTGSEYLFLFGASTRAAAFSALRAGLRPVCADLFGDVDLRARCPVLDLPPGGYPHAFLDLITDPRPGPWLFTGALENRPELVEAMAARRPLWGNNRAALERCRDPLFVAALLRQNRLPSLAVEGNPDRVPIDGRWLVKPLAGAGGLGIHRWQGERTRQRPRQPCYFQEWADGEPMAAVFVADGVRTRLLGVTQQLIGLDWLHVGPFRYCGSVGPVDLGTTGRRQLQRLGDVVAGGCGLRGLFGVDFVWRDATAYLVEINPRYTASVEVLEYASGGSALAAHRQVFVNGDRPGEAPPQPPTSVVGKAILFARTAFTFPADGPWAAELRTPRPVHELPAFADLPAGGQTVEAGHPILSFFVTGAAPADCRRGLRRVAADLDSWLFRDKLD